MAYQGGFQRLHQDDIASQNPTFEYTDNYGNQPWQSTEKRYPEPNVQQLSQATGQPTPNPNQNQPLMRTYFDTSPPVPTFDKSNRQRTQSSTLSKYASSIWSKTPFRAVSHVAAPLFAAPWRHEPCEDLGGSRGSTVRFFDRGKQRRRIFFSFLLQWFLTLLFCGIIVILFWHYSHREHVNRNQKYRFNAAFLGITLCLSFAVASGLKEYINILRWRLLARNYRNLQEFELVLGMASQKRALRLMWVGERWGTKLLSFFYVFLMLGIQIAIALLGLCQSVDTSTTLTDTIPGYVSIANLEVIAQAYDVNTDPDTSLLAQTGSANAFGIGAQSLWIIENPTKENITGRSQNTLFTDLSTYYTYNFYDWCPEDGCTSASRTLRNVTANAVCEQYEITDGGFVNSSSVTYLYPNGTEGIFSYGDQMATGVTTWFSDSSETCGPRCANVFALNVGIEEGEFWAPQIFGCNNTLTNVLNIEPHISNASLYEIPDEQARYFAGAIGFNGLSSPDSSWQYHVYDTSSFWSWTQDRDGNYEWTPLDAAQRVMQFSVGAVAGVDGNGQRTITYGETPVPAQTVTVKWLYSVIILGAIPGVQLLCLLLTVILGNSAVIKDESFLSTARLLRPVVDRLEKNGCALTSDEICEVLGNPRIAYGLHMPNTGNPVSYGGQGYAADEVMHLGILHERSAHDNMSGGMGWRVGRPMPQGRYDGSSDEENVGLLSGSHVDTKSRQRRLSL